MSVPDPELYIRNIQLRSTSLQMAGKMSSSVVENHTFLKQYFKAFDPDEDAEQWPKFLVGLEEIVSACQKTAPFFVDDMVIHPQGRHMKYLDDKVLLMDPNLDWTDEVDVKKLCYPKTLKGYRSASWNALKALAGAYWQALCKALAPQ